VCALLLAPAASAKPARPALTILTPLSGVTIADSVTVQARLNNVPGRRTFIYKIDGSQVGSSTTRSRIFSRTFSTHSLTNGVHTISVSALFSIKGKRHSRSASRRVSISNTPAAAAPGVTQKSTPPPPPPPPPKPHTTPPSKPSGIKVVTAAPDSVALQWNPSTDNVGVEVYVVRVDGVIMGVSSGTTLTADGLECESDHQVTVEARDAAGNSATSNASKAATDSCVNPSGAAMPIASLPGWKMIFAENFLVNAPLGSMGSDTDAAKVIYTGRRGTKWVTYPKNFLDTYDKRPYRSDQVLSVHDGVLDYWLHNVDGQPAGANPSPLINPTSADPQYQTYGRYSARLKVDDTDLSEYYIAWLLWPYNEGDWDNAESDYPEMPLVPGKHGVHGVAHVAPGQHEVFNYANVDLHEWHTYKQDWTPLTRNYYVDGNLIYTTINAPYSGPERWQLQTETKGNGTHSGHLLVDWAVVYSYNP
jgi:hypothetical protein